MRALNWRKKGVNPSHGKLHVLGSVDNMALKNMMIKDIDNNGAHVHMMNYNAERILSHQLQILLYFTSNIPPNCQYLALATHLFSRDHNLLDRKNRYVQRSIHHLPILMEEYYNTIV